MGYQKKWRAGIQKILVDFDGTLARMAWPEKPGLPYPFVVRALTELQEAGFEIVIFTSRLWRGWAEQQGADFAKRQVDQMVEWLAEWGIPYDRMTAEKEPAFLMIDDRSFCITDLAGQAGGWLGIKEQILREWEEGSYRPQSDPEEHLGGGGADA